MLVFHLLAIVTCHGAFTDPSPRDKGVLFSTLCGETAFKYGAPDGNLQADRSAQAQDIQQKKMKSSDCNLWLCQGRRYEDNKDKLQHYASGQTVKMHFNIHFTHPGIANVSIVDTKRNAMIGMPLKSWAPFSKWEIRFTDGEFSITVPRLARNQCVVPGECVIQMYWDARDIDQTYLSCIDFVQESSKAGLSPVQHNTTEAIEASKRQKVFTPKAFDT